MDRFGIPEEDWERLQSEHVQWQEDLRGLDVIPLWKKGTPGFKREYGQEEPKLCIIPSEDQKKGTVLVCAGGGFHMKSVFEGRVVAEKYASHGFQAAVLDYRCMPYSIWEMLDDVQRAVRILRLRGKKRIALCGFSAGGHLAAMAATLYRNANLYEGDEADQIKETPPFFMWMTGEDEVIHKEDFFEMAEALDRVKVPCELHLFPRGLHGIGLADGSSKFGKADQHSARWLELSCEWLENTGFDQREEEF